MSVRQIAKNAVFLGVASVVSRFLGIIGIGLTARLLSVEGFGTFNLILVIVTIISTICSAGTGPYIVRETSSCPEADSLAFLQAPLFLILGLSCVGAIGSFVIIPLLMPTLPSAAKMLLAMIIVTPLVSFLTSLNQGLQKFGRFFWISSIASLLLCAFTALVYFLKLGIAAFYAAYVLANILSLAAALGLCRDDIARIFRGGLRRLASLHEGERLNTFFFLFASSVLAILFNKIDILMINHMLGAKAVGIYSASYRIFEYVMYIPSIVSAALLPVLAANGQDRVKSSLFILRAEALFLLPVLAILLFFKMRIFNGLYGAGFSPNSTFLSFTILTFGVFFYTLNSIYGQIIYSSGGYRNFVFITASALAGNVGLNILLIPRMNIRGAALATVISFSISSVMHTFFAYRHTRRRELWFMLASGSIWFSAVLLIISAGSHALLAIPAFVGIGLLARYIVPGDFTVGASLIKARLRGKGKDG